MFSPSLNDGGPATATRSRRRQRPPSTDNSVQQPKAKRQRLPLTTQTFVQPDAQPEMYEVKPNRIPMLEVKPDGIENAQAAPKKELSVRSKKAKAGERVAKGDGSTLLTTTNGYSVSKLPALPDRIRIDAPGRQHGSIDSTAGYGLDIFHTHALVWPYTATTSSPETFTFTLPYPSKHPSDPLPLGCLVQPSASTSEPGLLVVMPQSGKITYWESISSAATLDFMRQQRGGLDGTIPGMSSGEIVTDLLSAESAGFVLTFSSGRLAFLSVRDAHGKPAVSVQPMRTSLGMTSSGLIGSIRNAFSGHSLRGDLAAVRADRSAKVGERTVVVATTQGKFQSWRIHRGGHHDLLTDVDAQEAIFDAVCEADPNIPMTTPVSSFSVIDLTFVPKGLEEKYVQSSRLSDATNADDSVQQILVLVATQLTRPRSGASEGRYALVELILTAEGVSVGMVRPLQTFTMIRPATNWRPTLYLPRPALVAFVVFEKEVVVASIATLPDSPESQLQLDTHTLPTTFEDLIDLRSSDEIEIVGTGFEEPQPTATNSDEFRFNRQKNKNPATLLLVRGVGVLRIAITEVDKFASDKPPNVTAKNKLEQAVFFGVRDQNPVKFEGNWHSLFTTTEIARAALELSEEIASSNTPYISNLPASLESNLRSRLFALEQVMQHISWMHDLDRATKWKLLAYAEKMHVAIFLWRLQEQFTASRPDNDKKTLISEIVEYIHATQKTTPNPSVGEVDAVRHWFIHDVHRLDLFVAWAYEVIKYVHKDRLRDEAGISRLIVEAMAIYSGAIQNAFKYRSLHLDKFMLGDEVLDARGLLLEGNYDGLPEPWTSVQFIVNNMKRLLDLCDQFLGTYYRQANASAVDAVAIRKMRTELPALTDYYLVSLMEFHRWAMTSQDPKTVQWGNHYAVLYEKSRGERLMQLGAYELWEDAKKVARKHHAMFALADLLVTQIVPLRDFLDSTAEPYMPEMAEAQGLWEKGLADIGGYMDQYGQAFAFAAFELLLLKAGVKYVLEFKYDKNGYLTRFLRSRKDLAKISWINDVEREQDIDRAADTLLNIGTVDEPQVWNRKIELSLSKLALLTEKPSTPTVESFAAASNQSGDTKVDATIRKIDGELAIIKIQDDLYKQIQPTVAVAIDEPAELLIAVEVHGAGIPKKYKGLLHAFEIGMGDLLKHKALDPLVLIDLLTLFTPRPEIQGEIENRFSLALQVADYALAGEEHRMTEKLIWRRCCNQDDWAQINNTQAKDDITVTNMLEDTCLFEALESLIYLRNRPREVSYKGLKASASLGVYTETLDRRYKDMDKGNQEKILDAMRWEDSVLSHNLEKNQLDKWFAEAVANAEESARMKADALTEASVIGAAINGPRASLTGRKGGRKRLGLTNGASRDEDSVFNAPWNI